MKYTALLLIAIASSAGALAQASPDNPATAQPQPAYVPAGKTATGLSMWDHIQLLPRGEKIKIQFGNGRWEHCVFAGAFDEYLYCASYADSGYASELEINRANISNFKIDHDERNGRLIFAAVTLGTGVALGIRCAQTQVYQRDAEVAGTLCGLLGAGLGTLPAMPLSCLSGHCVTFHLPPSPPMAFGIGVNVPLRGISLHRRR